jgi:hypothetical protein
VLTIFRLQAAGKLPEPCMPEWLRLLELADAGDVEIATVILIRSHDYVCEDLMAERLHPRLATDKPISLRDDLREMDILD